MDSHFSANSFPYILIVGSGSEEKTIEKETLQLIMLSADRPASLLDDYHSPLIDFLKQVDSPAVKRAIDLFLDSSSFYLTKFGSYCAVNIETKEVLIFDIQLVTYLKKSEADKRRWEGFAYKVRKSVYVGEFCELEAEGKGQGYFIQDPSFNMEYNGQWAKGEIKDGTAKVYKKNETNEPKQVFIEYKGKFKNFEFHGEGERTKDGVTEIAQFRQGTKIKKRILMGELTGEEGKRKDQMKMEE